MSVTYSILCVDCARYMSLGKLYWRSASGERLGEVSLDGVFDPTTRTWRKRDEIFGMAIEGFLIRHPNHQLYFAPEGVDELLETPDRVFEPIDLQDVLSPTEAENVDPERELEEWKAKLKR